MITQTDIDNLEAALVSGELQVRIGDRWITYRSVEEIKQAIQYGKEQIRKAAGNRTSTAYVGSVDRGLG